MSLLSTVIEANAAAFNAIPPGVVSQPIDHYGWYCYAVMFQGTPQGTLFLRLKLEDNERCPERDRHYLSGALEVVHIAPDADQPNLTTIPVDAEEDAHELVRDAVGDMGLDPKMADTCAVLSLINYAENLYQKTCQQALYAGSNIPF